MDTATTTAFYGLLGVLGSALLGGLFSWFVSRNQLTGKLREIENQQSAKAQEIDNARELALIEAQERTQAATLKLLEPYEHALQVERQNRERESQECKTAINELGKRLERVLAYVKKRWNVDLDTAELDTDWQEPPTLDEPPNE